MKENNTHKEEIEKLLDEAETIMNENIDAEIEILQGNSWANIDSTKYEKAKDIFEKILALDPKNRRALEGQANCMQMIEPYVPVQYMFDTTPKPEDLIALSIEPDIKSKPIPPP